MTADRDYRIMQELLAIYVQSEKYPRRVQSSIFYEHVKAKIGFQHDEVIESKVMRELRLRFFRGQGKEHEPAKFHEYFYNKFRVEIQNMREQMTGARYSRKQRVR